MKIKNESICIKYWQDKFSISYLEYWNKIFTFKIKNRIENKFGHFQYNLSSVVCTFTTGWGARIPGSEREDDLMTLRKLVLTQEIAPFGVKSCRLIGRFKGHGSN